VSDPLHDPEMRRATRGQLARELILRTLLHDVRGALTAALGWVELMGIDGSAPPKGLERSLEGIRAAAARYESLGWPEEARADSFERAASALGIELVGRPRPVVDALRLASALELVRPTRIELFVDPDAPRVLVARLHGVEEASASLALSPHPDDLFPRLHVQDQALGCCLLREVGRNHGGELRRREPGSLDLLLPS